MSIFRDININNNLNISSHLSVDSKIINDNIVYPIITISGTLSDRYINVDLKKFNNNKIQTNSVVPMIKWWISDVRWFYPKVVIAVGTSNPTITVIRGTNISPKTSNNEAILRTSVAHTSTHDYKIRIYNNNLSYNIVTWYFMCSVQGITYSQDFTMYKNA